MEGEMEIMGNKAPSLTYIVDGKGYKSDVDFNGARIITCYTDTSGCAMNPMAGQTVPTPVADDMLKSGRLQLDATGPLFNYAAKGNKVELLGKEGGAYKLKLTPPSNTAIVLFIDTASYQVLKTVTNITANGQQMEMTVENSDFRKTDFGTVMPYSMKLDFPGLTITNTSNKIEINKEIDKAVFEMPKN
jgi:outer membrane lipoprotein-sorting protein